MRRIDIPADPAARRAWIKYQLDLAGWTLAKLAKSRGLGRAAVAQALWQSGYPRAEEILAGALGLQPEQIWPERWAEREAKQTAGWKRHAHANSVAAAAPQINGKHEEAA